MQRKWPSVPASSPPSFIRIKCCLGKVLLCVHVLFLGVEMNVQERASSLPDVKFWGILRGIPAPEMPQNKSSAYPWFYQNKGE